MCLCDNIGLVALLLLGWELRASSITVLCVQAVMILSPLLFMPSLYSHSNSKNFTLLVYIACIVRNYDVSFTRNKRVNERIIHLYTFQEEVQFPCKISGPLFTWFTCFDISCIVRTDNHHFFKK